MPTKRTVNDCFSVGVVGAQSFAELVVLESTPHQLRECLSRHIDQLKASLQAGNRQKSLSARIRNSLFSQLPPLHLFTSCAPQRFFSPIMRTVRSSASNSLKNSCTPLRLAPCVPSNGMDSHEPSHQPMITKNFAEGCAPRFPREPH